MASITIQQAYEQGSLRLVFTCFRLYVRPGEAPCGQSSEVSIEMALAQWGKDKPLGEIRAYCSRCGSNEFVGVTAHPPGRLGKRGRR